ncbi:MAG: tetratricopeptide repeat protein [Rhodothermales bacterium]|nr:tetratricopeptide repeat protein [Rhodothermales bacterium]
MKAQRRKLLFGGIMLAIPVLFFVLLEAGLRVAGYGNAYPLFMQVPGAETYRIQNRGVANRYFSQQARVPTSIGDAFLAEKAPGTYRVFVQGGSSAAGYPYYYGGSPSRMLQQRLQQTYPGRRVEVINTAMAAVNSYTLLDFVPEIIEQQPDAVLIYAGHNEFYGALGIGSAESLGKSRFVVRSYLALQQFRTVQLLRSALAGIAGGIGGRSGGGVPGATLMERMVGEQEIPFGSPVYHAGIEQYRANLRGMLDAYSEAGVPVFVATVASNERDHPPFLSAPAGDEAAWTQELNAILPVLRDEGAAAALTRLDELAARDSLAADVHYLRGRALDQLERFEEARQAFVLAKDRDRLRFRASEDINRVIREEANRPGAYVVEAREALSAASPGGVIDSQLMLEHLHPNVDGYFILADAFYEAMLADGGLGGASPVPASRARTEVLLTPVDSLFGAYRVMQLMGSWPFEAPGTAWTDTLVARTPLEEVTLALFRGDASWLEATTAWMGYQSRQGNHRSVLLTALAQIQQYPFLPAPYASAGEALLRQRRADEALVYFGAALEREESAEVREVIGDIHAAKGDHAEALDAYRQATVLDATNPDYALKLGRSHALLGDTLAAETALERFALRHPDDERVTRVLEALRARR